MPVISKAYAKRINTELQARFRALIEQVATFELMDKYDGAGRGSHWPNPDAMCRTTGSGMDIRLAADDFKAILAEIRKLK